VSHGPKNEDFENDCVIFEFSRLPQSFDSKLQQKNKKTQKTDENEMPFPPYILLSYETMIRHLTLTAFPSMAKKYSIVFVLTLFRLGGGYFHPPPVFFFITPEIINIFSCLQTDCVNR